MNLFLAIFWLLLGITVLVWQVFTGDDSWCFIFGNFRISYGWFFLLLTLYNLARWSSVRAAKVRQPEPPFSSTTRRQRVNQREGYTSTEPPNPEFNFTEESDPSSSSDNTRRPSS